MNPKTGGQIALGCGLLLVLGSCLASGFFGFHVFLDPRGAISDDEAAPGLGAGVLCFLVSAGIVALGAFVAFRQQATDVGAGPGPGSSGATPGMSAQAPALGLGCVGLLTLLLSCVATGAVPYFNSEVERWERMLSEDRATGAAPIIIMIDEGAIEERRQSMYGSAASAACCGLTSVLLLGGAAALYMRSKKPG